MRLIPVRAALTALPLLLLCACSTPAGGVDASAPPQPQHASPAPTEPADVTATLRVLRDDLESIERDTGTELGVALYDGRINGFTGSLASLPSWSTVKVPIARAAQEYCDTSEENLAALITAAIEWSDNDAASRMLECVGTQRVAEEVARAGAAIEVSPAFGRSEWPLASAARYGWYLSTRDEDDAAIVGMRNIAEEQSWGLGGIDNTAFKGGWSGDRLDGSWHSRQMGFIRLDGGALGVAIAARSPDGSYPDTTEALDRVAAALGEQLGL